MTPILFFCDFLFAIGSLISYCYRCAYRNAGDAKMPLTPKEPIEAFRGAYGQLCMLMATAVHDGQSRDLVIEAAGGKGSQLAPVFARLRKQRKRVTIAVEACRTVPTAELIGAAREVKAAMESEWMLTLPRFTEIT